MYKLQRATTLTILLLTASNFNVSTANWKDYLPNKPAFSWKRLATVTAFVGGGFALAYFTTGNLTRNAGIGLIGLGAVGGAYSQGRHDMLAQAIEAKNNNKLPEFIKNEKIAYGYKSSVKTMNLD